MFFSARFPQLPPFTDRSSSVSSVPSLSLKDQVAFLFSFSLPAPAVRLLPCGRDNIPPPRICFPLVDGILIFPCSLFGRAFLRGAERPMALFVWDSYIRTSFLFQTLSYVNWDLGGPLPSIDSEEDVHSFIFSLPPCAFFSACSNVSSTQGSPDTRSGFCNDAPITTQHDFA